MGNPDEGTALVLGIIELGLGIVVFCVFIGIFARLGHARDLLTKIDQHLFRISHPEVPWPALPPSEIVLVQSHEGKEWRMRADGAWETLTAAHGWQPARTREDDSEARQGR